MAEYFLIKHRSSGRFFHLEDGQNPKPCNDTMIVMHSDMHDNMHWKFERIDGEWGYIVHANSGKVIHPLGGCLKPDDGTKLVIHSDRHWGALFAIDEVRDHIVHKSGRFAHPHQSGGRPDPGNGNLLVLHHDIHDNMKFQFVSPTDVNKEVHIYGKPMMLGRWKIINMILNPLAEHTVEVEYKVGKSEMESVTSTFKYSWEISAQIQIVDFSSSMEFNQESVCSSTWTQETSHKRRITVVPGNSVVTWQYVFEVEQNKAKGVFRSNLLADTESPDKQPKAIPV